MDIAREQSVASGTGKLSADRLEESRHVLLARDGNTDSFSWLMVRHERPLLYYLGRLIGRPEAALDVHQEVWLAVFRGLKGLREPHAFRAWLYRLAHDKAARFIHTEIRNNQNLQDSLPVKVVDSGPEESDAQRVHEALALLSPAHREVLTLHYLDELSLEEIAGAVDLPAGTIKSRLHYARIALRHHLRKDTR